MFSRHTLMLLMLMGAAGVPYLTSTSSDVRGKLSGLWSSSSKPEQGPVAGGKGEGPGTTGQQRPDAANAQLADVAVHDLNEVLNFDITPSWVMSHWPRVSASLAELDRQGYRVSLITGTNEHDVAGSLTYYFDKKQRLERIGFRGTTGDPRALVGIVTGKFELLRQPTDDPSLSLYQLKWNGKPRSELRVRPVSVVRSAVPRSRFNVELTLDRPR